MKTRKAFRLSEECLLVIDRVAEEKDISKTEALEIIIRRYFCEEIEKLRDEEWVIAFADILLEKYDQKYCDLHARLRFGVKSAEINSEVALNAANMLLHHFGIKKDYLLTEMKMPVIQRSQEHIRERINGFKQRKDSRRGGE